MSVAPLAGPGQVDALLSSASRVRALVVGDCMLDRYLVGEVRRISPEAPVPVLLAREERNAPGGAGNVAAGIRALGARCRLVGAVGEDAEGVCFRKLVTDAGVEAALERVTGRPTTLKVRAVAARQQMLRIDREEAGPLPKGIRRRLLARARESLGEASVLILTDHGNGVLGGGLGRALLRRARELGIPSLVDPRARHLFTLPGATVLKPNAREIRAAVGDAAGLFAPATLREVRERARCSHLLVTLGPEGMVLLREGEPLPLHIPSRAREVYDVTGAGDTVSVVLAVGLAAGLDVATAAALANRAAGIAVSRFGAVALSADEIRAELGAGTPAAGGVREEGP